MSEPSVLSSPLVRALNTHNCCNLLKLSLEQPPLESNPHSSSTLGLREPEPVRSLLHHTAATKLNEPQLVKVVTLVLPQMALEGRLVH